MMKFKTVFASMATAGVVLASGSASAAFSSFWFDPDGAGAGAAVLVNEYFDFTGAVYSDNTYTGATSFNLQQSGYAAITGKDGGLPFLPFIANQVIASFSGGGTGDLLTGSTTFTDGSITLYSGGFGGAAIAEFDIVSGGAFISPVSGAPNGASTLNGVATSFTAGYFFLNDGGVKGADFSLVDLMSTPLFGFATTNLSFAENQDTIDEINGVLVSAGFGPLSPGNVLDENGRLTSLYSGANGQFRLTESQVPEPGSLVLAGLGLLGLGMFRRKARG